MAKFTEKIKARELRLGGESIKVIAKQLGVSKSTVSLWCLDIELTAEQVESLNKRKSTGGYAGRMLGANMQKERKRLHIQALNEEGVRRMHDLSLESLLMLGLGLYFGEGNKGHEFQFTNSNPGLIKFVIMWLERCFEVVREDIYCRVLINQIHSERTSIVERRWSEILSVPLLQFRKTTLIKVANKKIYQNHDSHLGTLALRVCKSTILQRQLLGLMHGLVYNIMR